MLTISNCSLRGFVIACRWARINWGNVKITDLTEEQNKKLQSIANEWDRRQKQ